MALGRACLFPPLSSGGALVARPWLRFHTPLIGRVGDWRRFRSKFVFPVGSLFRLRVSHHLDHATFPATAASNAACGFPRTALTCLLRLKAYGTYPAGTAFSAGRTTR